MADYDAQPGRERPPQPELSQAQIEADEIDLHAGLSGVAGIVADARQVSEILRDVAEFAVQAIPGAEDAGATLTQSCADAREFRRGRSRRRLSNRGTHPSDPLPHARAADTTS